jgi:hypothetical protein
MGTSVGREGLIEGCCQIADLIWRVSYSRSIRRRDRLRRKPCNIPTSRKNFLSRNVQLGSPPSLPPPPSPPTQPNSNFVVCLIWKANGTNSNPNKENVPAENPNNRKHKLAQTQIQDGHPPLRTLSKPHHPPSQAFSGGFKEHGTCDRVSFIF